MTYDNVNWFTESLFIGNKLTVGLIKEQQKNKKIVADERMEHIY